jgi:hypothetical protein
VLLTLETEARLIIVLRVLPRGRAYRDYGWMPTPMVARVGDG